MLRERRAQEKGVLRPRVTSHQPVTERQGGMHAQWAGQMVWAPSTVTPRYTMYLLAPERRWQRVTYNYSDEAGVRVLC